MIILHSAVAEKTKQNVHGYVLREGRQVFIMQEDGRKIPVKAYTVMPCQACLSESGG